ncbi:hypothetical protein ACFOW1_09505 [Parasediminibacterium paludis]|uniref:Uncharacterized protein n=1 Tax=Parasediminibacterium paludis TaxID=908966 RepID=A0ABV8PYK9_9BACT
MKSFINKFQRDWISDSAGNSAVQTAANSALPGSGAILGVLGSLFASKPNPNDWQGWDAQDSQNNRPPGTSVAWWVIHDGDNVQNEALNAISYMRTKMQGVQKVYDAASQQYGLNAAQFTAKLVDKFRRAGYPNEAAQFAAYYGNITTTATTPPPLNQPGAATPIAQSTVYTQMPSPTGSQILQTGTASTDTVLGSTTLTSQKNKTWLIIGIVGGVIVLAGVIWAVAKFTGKAK